MPPGGPAGWAGSSCENKIHKVTGSRDAAHDSEDGVAGEECGGRPVKGRQGLEAPHPHQAANTEYNAQVSITKKRKKKTVAAAEERGPV